MKTTRIYTTEATAAVTISTVLVRDGAARFYETALVVNGQVSDGVRRTRKADAGLEHDEWVAAARGYRASTARTAAIAAFVAVAS